jgi:dCMP deaminase
MEVAQIVAKRGTCDRKQVGAVIARDGRIISVGYNGAPPGLPHCSNNNHGWHETDWPNPDGSGESPKLWEEQQLSHYGCRNTTHAEANALAFAARYGVSTDGAELFVTVSPCDVCARLLIAAGITTVHSLEIYRDRTGINLLDEAGIRTTLAS